MTEGTIYFATPDSNRVLGGIRQIYRVVDALNAAGMAAAVAHSTPGFRCTWFPNSTTVRYAGELELSEDDLLVLPELWAYRVPGIAPGIPKVIFNQNHFYTFRGMTSDGADVYGHEDVKGAIVVSEESESFLRSAFPDVRTERLRYAIDLRLYHPDDPKSRAIAYMPRKRPEEAAAVLALLQLRGALDGWEVLAIDGVDEASAAAILRRSQVFLCFSHREGFGLPPAEAMAAGSIVVGFDGFGGRELFRDHGLGVPEGDVVAFARSVEGLLKDWDRRAEVLKETAKRASEFVRDTYTIEQHASDAIRIFSSFQNHGTSGVLRVPLEPFEKSTPRWRLAGSHLKKAASRLAAH